MVPGTHKHSINVVMIIAFIVVMIIVACIFTVEIMQEFKIEGRAPTETELRGAWSACL